MSGARTQRALSRRQVVQGAGVVGLGLLAGCGRWPGQATPAKVPRVGVLFVVASASSPEANAVREGLRELGYVDGQNVSMAFRSAEGSLERLDALATELIQLPVDIIVTGGE